MGFKKEIKHQVVQHILREVLHDKRKLRKLLVVCLAFGLFLAAGAGILLYAAFHFMGNMFASAPDIDIQALKTLVTDKVIVLNQGQKNKMEKLLAELSAPELNQQKREMLRAQLLALLEPGQMKDFNKWRDTATEQAKALTAIPLVSSFIAESTGLSIGDITANIKAFLAWFDLVKPDNSAELLRQALVAPEQSQWQPAGKP